MQRAETQIEIASLTAGIHAAVVLSDFDTAFVLMGHLQSVVLVARAIDLEHRRVSRAYFLRMDLLFPKEAPYWKVLQANTEGGYWQLVRTSKPMFDLICSKWNPEKVLWRDGYAEDAAGGMVPRRGRPNMLDARSVCALTLAWLGSTGPNNRLLEQIFGIGHSVTDRDIEEGLDSLIEALEQIPEAAIEWPTRREMDEMDAMIRDACGANPYFPHVKFFSFVDNKRTPTDAAPEGEDDDDYNGWVHGHTKNTNLVFSAKGKIIHMSIGHKGKTHDYTTAATFFEKVIPRCAGRARDTRALTYLPHFAFRSADGGPCMDA